MRMRYRPVLIVLMLLLSSTLFAQEKDSLNLQQLPAKYAATISSKAAGIESKLDKKSTKALAQLKKQEDRIIRKLAKTDSSKAKEMAAVAKARYAQLEAKLKGTSKLTSYIPGLDSMNTTLNFLNNSATLTTAKEKVQDALGKVDGLKTQLQKAEDIKAFLKERKQYLVEKLKGTGLAKGLKKLNKQVYYYAQQLNEYKSMLNDPKKIEKKALELLSKTKIWKDFFRKNSMLASLFRIPDPDQPIDMASLAGLQTRAQVNNLVQQQIAAGGPSAQRALQQNLQAAQSQLNQLKNKVLKAGGGSSDDLTPDPSPGGEGGFRPNPEKTKSFWKRLEYGTNLQTQKATNFFPVTSDLGLSLGYKLNDKSVIGIGASYKLGWGRGWNNIALSSQGMGIRSYVDWKIKGSFWISGGYEKNLTPNPSPRGEGNVLRSSGLLGVSKTVSIKSKLFKKTKLMLLWDFLSYQQVPRTQPVVFRIGYNF